MWGTYASSLLWAKNLLSSCARLQGQARLSPLGHGFLPVARLQASLCLFALNLVAYTCCFTITEGYLCDCWCGLSLPPSVALLLWRDLGRTALIWQQLQWDPTLCMGHTFCPRKRAVLQRSNVSFCGITCSLLSPCSPVLWCWEPFCGLWVGLWSLASDFLGTKDLLQGSQWGALDSVMPVYCLMLPLKKCGKSYPLHIKNQSYCYQG